MTAIFQIAVTLPRWEDDQAKVSIVLALLVFAFATVGAVRAAGGTKEDDEQTRAEETDPRS